MSAGIDAGFDFDFDFAGVRAAVFNLDDGAVRVHTAAGGFDALIGAVGVQGRVLEDELAGFETERGGAGQGRAVQVPFSITSGEDCEIRGGRGDLAGEVDNWGVRGVLDVAVDTDAVRGFDFAGEVDGNAAGELFVGEIVNGEAVAVAGNDFDVAFDGEGSMVRELRISVSIRAGNPEDSVTSLVGTVVALEGAVLDGDIPFLDGEHTIDIIGEFKGFALEIEGEVFGNSDWAADENSVGGFV